MKTVWVTVAAPPSTTSSKSGLCQHCSEPDLRVFMALLGVCNKGGAPPRVVELAAVVWAEFSMIGIKPGYCIVQV